MIILALALSVTVATAASIADNSTTLAQSEPAPIIVPSANGTIWQQPSIIDESRASVNNSLVAPTAQNGAWVESTPTPINTGFPPSLPANPGSDLLVAQPGQPGALKSVEGANVAVPVQENQTIPDQLPVAANSDVTTAASANETTTAASANTMANNGNSSNETTTSTLAVVPAGGTTGTAESAPNATAINANETASSGIVNNANVSSLIGPNAPPGSVVPVKRVERQVSSHQAAFISTSVGNAQSNQTVPVSGNQPIVAILPPGSNLTATWNISAGGPRPAVILGPQTQLFAANAAIPAATAEPAVNTTAISSDVQSSGAPAVVAINETTTAIPANDTNAEAATSESLGETTLAPAALKIAADLVNAVAVVASAGNATASLANETTTEASIANSNASTSNLNNSPSPVAMSNNETETSTITITVANASDATILVPAGSQVQVQRVARQAVITTEIGDAKNQQSVPVVGNQPIVAILPPGSNLTATWNATGNSQSPTIAIGPLDGANEGATTAATVAAAAPAALAMPVAESNETVTTTVATVATVATEPANNTENPSTSNTQSDAGLPFILPMGTKNFNDTSLLKVPGVMPIDAVASNLASALQQKQPGPSNSSATGDKLMIFQNKRLEVDVIKFEMINNLTAVSQDIILYGKLTVGAMPPELSNAAGSGQGDPTPINPANPQLVAPESTSGYTELYQGPYNKGELAFDHVVSADLCGLDADKGILNIIVKPMKSQEGFATFSFTCAMNMAFNTATRNTESFWSEPQLCTTQPTSNGSVQKLWYKVRNYNIDWGQCQQQRPGIAQS